MDVDKVLVNGVELTKDSSLATLRAACSFLGISGSGSKIKVYTKISFVSEAKAQETREALGQSVAKMPDEATQARRGLTRAPYANCRWSTERKYS